MKLFSGSLLVKYHSVSIITYLLTFGNALVNIFPVSHTGGNTFSDLTKEKTSETVKTKKALPSGRGLIGKLV